MVRTIVWLQSIQFKCMTLVWKLHNILFVTTFCIFYFLYRLRLQQGLCWTSFRSFPLLQCHKCKSRNWIHRGLCTIRGINEDVFTLHHLLISAIFDVIRVQSSFYAYDMQSLQIFNCLMAVDFCCCMTLPSGLRDISFNPRTLTSGFCHTNVGCAWPGFQK